MALDVNQILREIRTEVAPFQQEGELATYIPELARVNPDGL